MTSSKYYTKIKALTKEHENIQRKAINLIPTENLLSPVAKRFLLSESSQRYALANPPADDNSWYMKGGDTVNEIEAITEKSLNQLFGSTYANTLPLSGMNCALIMMYSLAKAGDTIFSMEPRYGGHGSMKSIANRLSLKVEWLPFDLPNLTIDADKCAKSINKIKPKLIYLDSSIVLFPYTLKELTEQIDENVTVCYDGSQGMGLIAGGQFQKPFKEGADFLSGSVHKSFFGPQRAIILSKDKNDKVRQIDYDSKLIVSNKHLNDLIALSISTLEMQKFGKSYASQVVKNAKAFAQALSEAGFKVEAEELGFTESHQVWVDPRPLNSNLKATLDKLAESNIFINLMRIPSIQTNGWRIGVQELTRLGMKESEMKFLANLIAANVFDKKSPAKVKQDVVKLREEFQSVKYCFNETPKELKKLEAVFLS